MSGPRISSFRSGVQVERVGDVIAVTASADRMRRELLFSLTEWDAFLADAAAGEFSPDALQGRR